MAAKAGKTPAVEDAPGGAAERSPDGRRRLLMIGVPVLLAAGGAGAWFAGLLPLPGLSGMAAMRGGASPAPVFVDLPEIVSNLNVSGRRASFVRLRAKLEIARAGDLPVVNAAMPRLLDLFATYLREVRPEELRGSAGSHRLREELIARATLAAAPAVVTDVLFLEILVQ